LTQSIDHGDRYALGEMDPVAGFMLGAAYVLSERNLWVCILAHGFIDTFGVTAAFFR